MSRDDEVERHYYACHDRGGVSEAYHPLERAGHSTAVRLDCKQTNGWL